ncbi:BC1872 family protein [Cohnella abietis]|uniref:Phage ABA sandwich domain-containing protein n=1 Tax=Cohnella abietis TaxID=2507935 RepID=A0A3T1D348_9BACL|nr:hypothetical protein [Cohnella abietis]BBI32468.1 hypothetical protein KCTCHS21_18670 [Cohnella abietis]
MPRDWRSNAGEGIDIMTQQYTRDQILAMEPKELSIAVAVEVMRFEPGTVTLGGWNPAEDISAAWEVLEKFEDYGVLFTQTRAYYCFIQTTKQRYQSSSCLTAPEAICKAALLAVMEL